MLSVSRIVWVCPYHPGCLLAPCMPGDCQIHSDLFLQPVTACSLSLSFLPALKEDFQNKFLAGKKSDQPGLPQTLQQEFSLINVQIRNVNVEVLRPVALNGSYIGLWMQEVL